MDAFDADVLIYAAVPGHPLGQRVASLFQSATPTTTAGVGSVLLLPEVLSRPLRWVWAPTGSSPTTGATRRIWFMVPPSALQPTTASARAQSTASASSTTTPAWSPDSRTAPSSQATRHQLRIQQAKAAVHSAKEEPFPERPVVLAVTAAISGRIR